VPHQVYPLAGDFPIPGLNVSPGDRRAVVNVAGLEHHHHADDTWDALVAWNEHKQPTPPILLRGDTLTRVSFDEHHVKLATFSKPALKELLSEAVVFAKISRDPVTGEPSSAKRVAVPPYIIDALLHRTPDRLPNALRINRVVEVPVYGRDGKSVLGLTGYDPESRTYLQLPPGLDLPQLMSGTWADDTGIAREVIQQHDAQAAIDLIWDLLIDFPFGDESSRAHAIAMMIEPFVREYIGDEPTPMYGVIAHTPGTGKGLLTQVCLGVACGPSIPVMVYTGGRGFEAAENRKALTSKLIEAPPVIFFDNVNEPLDSAALAAALTATRWNDRILGSTRMADVPIRNAWVFTSNNPDISAELTRRIVPIYLDPGDVDPTSRTGWKHKLPEWANEHRGDLAAAALTLAGHYLEGTQEDVDWEGEVYRSRPEVNDVLASYPRWSKTMGGILKAAGVSGFLQNLERLHAEAAVNVSERGVFLADWFDRQVEPVTLDHLAIILGEYGGHPAAQLPLELRGQRDNFTVKLGYWLRAHRDSVNGGYRVRKVEGRHAKWSVEKIGG
jgi:hypothetical protein